MPDHPHPPDAFCGNAGPEELNHLRWLAEQLSPAELGLLCQRAGIVFPHPPTSGTLTRWVYEGVLDEMARETFYREFHRLLQERPPLTQHGHNGRFHISVGAVLVNESGKVVCHYRPKEKVYILMRETPEPGEPWEQALHRGLREEMGAEGEIQSYLGPLISTFPGSTGKIEKCTHYFLVRGDTSIDRKPDDEEADSHLQWHPADFLIEKMATQNTTSRTDMDESVILRRWQSLPA